MKETFVNSQLNDMMEKYKENTINKDIFYEEEKRDRVKAAREEVIRNSLKVDEGDPFNELLHNKTINELKSKNLFAKVESEVIEGSTKDYKTINITVEEKPTGEISVGAGYGTRGGALGFTIKENNFLGNGIGLDTNFSLSSKAFKGRFSVTNPNYKNSDKSLYVSAEASENDNLNSSGYKTNKTGISIGTNFEYLNDFYLGVNNSHFYEKIETNSTASAMQKKQQGNYWDSFVRFDMNYDKRNQKYQTNSGFKSFYSLDLPIVSDTSTIKNYYNYSHYFDFFEKNFSSISIYLQSANSLNNKDIKLS